MPPTSGLPWHTLSHAYGSAGDVPALLDRARSDTRPSHISGSTWFDLWSALCHQGDVYSASYAAAPSLVEIADSRAGSPHQFDPLHLIACIELARLEGRGPPLPRDLALPYETAITKASQLTVAALTQPWPADFREALEGGLAALKGDAVGARAILDADLLAEGE